MLRSYNIIFWLWFQPIYGPKFQGFSPALALTIPKGGCALPTGPIAVDGFPEGRLSLWTALPCSAVRATAKPSIVSAGASVAPAGRSPASRPARPSGSIRGFRTQHRGANRPKTLDDRRVRILGQASSRT
jgi:hypothetical protein